MGGWGVCVHYAFGIAGKPAKGANLMTLVRVVAMLIPLMAVQAGHAEANRIPSQKNEFSDPMQLPNRCMDDTHSDACTVDDCDSLRYRPKYLVTQSTGVRVYASRPALSARGFATELAASATASSKERLVDCADGSRNYCQGHLFRTGRIRGNTLEVSFPMGGVLVVPTGRVEWKATIQRLRSRAYTVGRYQQSGPEEFAGIGIDISAPLGGILSLKNIGFVIMPRESGYVMVQVKIPSDLLREWRRLDSINNKADPNHRDHEDRSGNIASLLRASGVVAMTSLPECVLWGSDLSEIGILDPVDGKAIRKRCPLPILPFQLALYRGIFVNIEEFEIDRDCAWSKTRRSGSGRR